MPQIKSRAETLRASAPDDAALLAAATEHELPTGRKIMWLAPDLELLMAFTGDLPDPITAAVYHLLRDEGELDEKDDPRSYDRQRNRMRGKMQIAAHGMVKPKFDPELAVGDGNGTWGRRELPSIDLDFIYSWLFRLATTPALLQMANADQSGRTTPPPPDSGEVRDDSGGAVEGD
jgi:hypothetical protein